MSEIVLKSMNVVGEPTSVTISTSINQINSLGILVMRQSDKETGTATRINKKQTIELIEYLEQWLQACELDKLDKGCE